MRPSWGTTSDWDDWIVAQVRGEEVVAGAWAPDHLVRVCADGTRFLIKGDGSLWLNEREPLATYADPLAAQADADVLAVDQGGWDSFSPTPSALPSDPSGLRAAVEAIGGVATDVDDTF